MKIETDKYRKSKHITSSQHPSKNQDRNATGKRIKENRRYTSIAQYTMSIASEDTPLDDDNDSNADVVMQLPLVVNNNNTDADENTSKEEMVSLSLCKLSPTRRLVLLKPELFLRKVVLVFVASYMLLPLLAYKNSLPGALYVSLLILIHVGVLFLYLYRVTFQDLDVDRLSLGGRILGLVVVTWLLTVVSGWQDRTHVGILAIQMLVLCLVHTVMLALLMVAVEKEEEE